MASTPPPVPQRSPKRNSTTRTPLQERSRSEANEISSRLVRDTRDDPKSDFISSKPYPTKPSHVLLPSTLRKQRGATGRENALPAIPGLSQSFASGSQDKGNGDRPPSSRAPTLTLKRSVATLRDMYEAQAEKSRPSTAASPPLRPTTSNSKLRSLSSSEGLSGRYAWDLLKQASSDDLAMLPSLAQAMATVKNITSESSFQSRAARNQVSSSPNFVTFGRSSSPKMAVYNDLSSPVLSPIDQTSNLEPVIESSSSPNVVRLGRSSSFDESTDLSSSPNFVKLGSSSPSNVTTALSSSSPAPTGLEGSLGKRKRTDEGPSFAARVGTANVVPSSPPYAPSVDSSSAQEYPSPDNSVALPSSPPKRELAGQSTQDSSPANPQRKFSFESSSENRSLADTHASLQAVLTSSPIPAIQYPVVKAPSSTATAGLSIPKRPARTSADPASPKWTSRLSTVPSEWSGTRTNSKRSSFVEDFDEDSDGGSVLAASRAFATGNPEANSSQARMVHVTDVDADRHEASDEVSALPRHEFQYQSQGRSPAPPARTSSYLGTLTASNNNGSRLNSLRTGMDNRLNSMKSFANSRHSSFQSSSQRPSSSSSAVSNFVVPTWARRYYSGVYRDSFQHMYPSAQVTSTNDFTPIPTPGRPSTSFSRTSKPSDRSARQHFPLNIFRARARLEPRQSHAQPGIGPLVSNPVRPRPPPPAALSRNAQIQTPPAAMIRNVQVHTPPNLLYNFSTPTIRKVSLHPADPRAHWAGVTPEHLHVLQERDGYPHPPGSRQSSLVPRRARASEWSPHLHRGPRSSFRLNRWHAPSVYETSEKWFNLRDGQVLCFLCGFVCPLAWFVGALLQLPGRPGQGDLESGYDDLEKERNQQSSRMGVEEGDLSMDLEARLRRQMARADLVRYNNARWWRGLNRFMCAVGIVVIALVVALAVLGTTRRGF